VKKDIGSGTISDKQHDLQFEIGRATGNKSMSFGVMDNGAGVIQVKESGSGYNSLLLNPVSNSTTTNYVGINKSNPSSALDVAGTISSSALDVAGTISTNKMLLRTYDYNRTFVPDLSDNLWNTAIDNNILTAECVYIITLRYQVGPGGRPWNLYTSFLHFCGVTNSYDNNYTSGAAVPTSVHDADEYDYQIYVRGKIGSGSISSGVEFKCNTATATAGTWNVKAYRII
jgi:hypothetical protein